MTARPSKDPSVPGHHLWPLLLGYVRYAMGRQSTAPITALDLVRCYGRHLCAEQRTQIADEIRHELQRCEGRGQWLGARCDHNQWRELLHWLDAEVVR